MKWTCAFVHQGMPGLLVTSLDAFAEYQHQNAWTWEHQALVRARVVAGSEALADKFDELRGSILRRERDPQALRDDVVSMRHKMRDHLGTKGEGANLSGAMAKMPAQMPRLA